MTGTDHSVERISTFTANVVWAKYIHRQAGRWWGNQKGPQRPPRAHMMQTQLAAGGSSFFTPCNWVYRRKLWTTRHKDRVLLSWLVNRRSSLIEPPSTILDLLSLRVTGTFKAARGGEGEFLHFNSKSKWPSFSPAGRLNMEDEESLVRYFEWISNNI